MNSTIISPLLSSERQKKHILVVEDNVALRFTLAEWLRMQGYVVLEANTADEAMDVLGSQLSVDLVLTDVHMPGSMDGLALVQHISTAYPLVKTIIVSGKAHPSEMAKEAVFFGKPYDLVKVTECIKKLLAESE